jgi:adenine-specific DNA-methyltransferase
MDAPYWGVLWKKSSNLRLQETVVHNESKGMSKKQKLELTWIGKENRPRLEPRILLEDPEKSYHAKQRVSDKDIFDNRLIFGDNLLALKALEQEFAGKVKCVYIDPPYNTGSAFTHYDDGVEHSIWLSLMRARLEILWSLLDVNEGSIWISIDDDEHAYLKVLCDETFGRNQFVTTNVWQKRYAPDARVAISDAHEYILCYAKNPQNFKCKRNLLLLTDAQTKQFRNPDKDPRGPWKADNFTAPGFRANQMYEITLPSGRIVTPPGGRCWRFTKDGFEKAVAENTMYYGPDGDGAPSIKRFLSEMPGMVPWTWWSHIETGHSQEGTKESQVLFGSDNSFSTPKPERLIQRIIHIASNHGDLILDSFAGSGTTGAVAHKMGRRWIMVELGDHAHTYIIPRLHKVIDGEDHGGVTEATGWKGGGGFRYYHIAPTLLEKDAFDNLVISKKYNPAMLTEAMCKIMGFQYAPGDLYWQQGRSTETDYIYVTTQTLTRDHLTALSDEVGKKRSLLVCCAAFRGKADAFPNLTLKKIPLAVLQKCEWGHDDYSLNVANLPQAPEPMPAQLAGEAPLEPKQARKRRARIETMPSLFDGGAE